MVNWSPHLSLGQGSLMTARREGGAGRKGGGPNCSLQFQAPDSREGQGTAWRESNLRHCADLGTCEQPTHRQRCSEDLPFRELHVRSTVNSLTLGAHHSNLPGTPRDTGHLVRDVYSAWLRGKPGTHQNLGSLTL